MRRIFCLWVFVLSLIARIDLVSQADFVEHDLSLVNYVQDSILSKNENQLSNSNVTLTCPEDKLIELCKTQAEIDLIYKDWIESASYTTTCISTISNNSTENPNYCGSSMQVTWTLLSDCADTLTCSSNFSIIVPKVELTCPKGVTVADLNTPNIETLYSEWKSQASFIHGCNSVISNDGNKPLVNGCNDVTFIVSSNCEEPKKCTSSFMVGTTPSVSLTCPPNQTEAACQSQETIDARYKNWLQNVQVTGGCATKLIVNYTMSPNSCGSASVTTFTVQSESESDKSCQAVFTVTAAPNVVLNCPANRTESACQDQLDINEKFKNWLNSASFTGGCNGTLTNSSVSAPNKCGGTATVTFTTVSDCQSQVNCTATFRVDNPPTLVIICPANITEPACQSQTDIDTNFDKWKRSIVASGGCNAFPIVPTGNAPDKCGGTTTLTFEAQDLCSQTATCSSTFTVASPPSISITCPRNVTEAACQLQSTIDSKFASWKSTVLSSGGCSVIVVDPKGTAPDKCGGTTTLTFEAQDLCSQTTTCTSTFTVTGAPSLVITCPENRTEAPCQTQSEIDAKFNNWKNSAKFIGGCNGIMTNSGGSAPDKCGGVTTVTFTASSDCEPNKTCTATFAVSPAPNIVLKCLEDFVIKTDLVNEIEEAYNKWLTEISITGGCNYFVTHNGPKIPKFGVNEVTFTITSDCEAPIRCTSKFEVGAVAVKDIHSSELNVSIQPNPIRNQLQVLIKGNYTGKFEFRISDLTGKNVYQSTEIKNKEELIIKKDASTLNQGSYILTIISKKGQVSEKFVVLR